MKITIGGVSGTGKSTVARKLAERLGYKKYSGGDMQRMNAVEKGMTIEEYDKYLIKHPELDNAIEERQRVVGQQEDNFVLESRIGWFVVPDALKVKLGCDLDERIRRIAHDTTDRIAHEMGTIESTKEKTLNREETYKIRFNELYGISDWNADEHFDIVVDTSNISVDEVIEIIYQEVQRVNKEVSVS